MIYGPTILTVMATLMIAVLGLAFRAGKLDSRVESLEVWRGTIRTDMHEISDQITGLSLQVANVETLIRERTDRRSLTREAHE